ncbi:uncharacterized protein ACR2FA_007529 [Aphomia sociella]
MAYNICFLFFLCITVSVIASELEVINGKIKITTVTTAGCIHTVNFIGEQLAPTYAIYGEYLDIHFVPWGRTQWHENGTITCQFLQNDCWANRLQRCVLNFLKDDQDAQMRYMNCEFTGTRPAFFHGSYVCAQREGLSLVDVDYCLKNPELDNLDRIAQEASVAPMDPDTGLNAVPAVVFNDVIDPVLYTQARNRLESLVCFALANITGTDVSFCPV